MRKLTFSNYLFLIPMLLVGPVILAGLIIHGVVLDRYYRVRRWYSREVYSARIIPINTYLTRQLGRR
jgi:hypothetical protein